MNCFIKKKITLALIICTSTLGFSQENFQGKVEYISKVDINKNQFNTSNLSEAQKKRMLERMSTSFQKAHTLVFNQAESIFKINSDNTNGNLHKDFKNKQQLKSVEVFGKKFIISSALLEFKWELTGRSKYIGKYTCYEAITKRTIKEAAPKQKNKKENSFSTSNKEINVTAWYTKEIPVNNGPAEYGGLPGLILELKADKTTYVYSKIALHSNNKKAIKKSFKGKKISQDEFLSIATTNINKLRKAKITLNE